MGERNAKLTGYEGITTVNPGGGFFANAWVGVMVVTVMAMAPVTIPLFLMGMLDYVSGRKDKKREKRARAAVAPATVVVAPPPTWTPSIPEEWSDEEKARMAEIDALIASRPAAQ